MIKYICRRLFHTLFMIAGISLIVFLITNVIGDPLALLVPLDATHEDIANISKQLGLDEPIHERYLIFLKNLLKGDFGESFIFEEPAMDLVWEHLPATMELTLAAMLIAVFFAIPIGIISAIRPYSLLDRIARFFALIGQASPSYWLGIMAILFFGVKLRILPISGRGGLDHLILPAATLGFYAMAAIMRLTRSAMLDVMDMDFIRTARIKGLGEKKVILKHAFKNALIPVVTIVSLFTGRLLGGAVITETIFAWPGLGRLSIQAVQASDFPLVQAAVFMMSIFFIFINLVVDILYSWIDPRIVYGK
jgi:peptide/nickel transport system permease protein